MSNDKVTKRIPSKLLRALKVFATMKPEVVMCETQYSFGVCQEAVKTAQEYVRAERMEVDDEST